MSDDSIVMVSAEDKSFPARAWGLTERELVAESLSIDDFPTPLLTLDAGRIESNIRCVARWATAAGFALAPHGKTTMAPTLWNQQLAAGAWGITLATAWQVQFARSVGIARILLANALVDPVAIAWLAGELDAHDDFEFLCWADSVETVRLMSTALGTDQRRRPIRVLVELGAPGGRTGARSLDTALAVAAAIESSPGLELTGCGGYEGAVAHDRGGAGLDRVAGYLDDLVALHRQLEITGAYGERPAVVTVGGSAYLDLVEAALSPAVDPDGLRGTPTTVVVRAGAYIVHDDGFYREISPLDASKVDDGLRSAMHGWVRIVSRPEPGLAIFDGGKRDLPYDEGMPEPQLVRGLSTQASAEILRGSSVTKLNDQHGFLSLGSDAAADALPVGSILRLGLSHPCTAFDKWRAIPLIDDADAEIPTVTGIIRTHF